MTKAQIVAVQSINSTPTNELLNKFNEFFLLTIKSTVYKITD